MAFKLFKNGDDLYDDAKELLKRGEYEKARSVLVKSIEKEGGVDDVAAVKVALIDLRESQTYPGCYADVISALDKTNATEFEFGLTTVDCARLRTECDLFRRERTLFTLSQKTKAEKAKALQDLAQDYQSQVGDSSFIIRELFDNDSTVTGTTKFFDLMAESYEILSEDTVWRNPSQAAEYEQIAMGYRQQNGQSGELNRRKIKAYSSTCRCWLCGRVATGEGIHFYSTPAEVSPSLEGGASAGARSSDGDEHIYVCRACYTAVSNRSDEISRGYYDDAMSEMANMEARLQTEIAALESQIALLRMSR